MHLSKTVGCTTPKMNSNISYGLWVMKCSYRLISCNKYTTLMEDVDNGRGDVWWV